MAKNVMTRDTDLLLSKSSVLNGGFRGANQRNKDLLLGLTKRLDYLATLKDGWYDGIQGKSLNSQSLHWLSDAFRNYYDTTLPLPSLYPTLDGKVQAEWSLPVYELSMTFDINNKAITYQFLRLDNDDTEEGSLPLNAISDWRIVNSLLKKYETN
jgi:hypothetical protein